MADGDTTSPGSTRSAHHAVGRPRDSGRDEVIVAAARDLISEVGFDAMTMDAVAARAGAGKSTLYRRWSTKEELAVDALTWGLGPGVSVHDVPDTGSLRGDLAELERLKGGDRSDRVMAGILPALRRDHELARVFHDRFVVARVGIMRAVLERARERGEVPPERDLDMVATVAPAMAAFRLVIGGERPDPGYMARVVDEVIVPLATAPVSPA
ncbi:TetR/AcrR family transcriptional regulator [Paraoerskovia marina]|uniref:TetR/AcrR family transcriptional regulator n=1 Tax=Paraoerskovia marina TaxID=545619 RepID=UPI0004925A82|nr:TetR/AcrR family transcriptional regulator [Paraoerskovia marina]